MKLWHQNALGSLAGVIFGGSVVLALTSCDSAAPDTQAGTPQVVPEYRAQQQPAVWHDDKRGVTCWTRSEGMSCLPDWMLERSKRAPVIDSRCRVEGFDQVDGCRLPSAIHQVVSM